MSWFPRTRFLEWKPFRQTKVCAFACQTGGRGTGILFWSRSLKESFFLPYGFCISFPTSVMSAKISCPQKLSYLALPVLMTLGIFALSVYRQFGGQVGQRGFALMR